MTNPGNQCLRLFLACAVSVLLSINVVAEAARQTPAAAPLTVSQVVALLIEKTAERTEALERYQGHRSYSLEYVGFPTNLRAEMTVDMDYQAPASKQFTVVSESGSKWIITHIFKRLLDSESEALSRENRGSTSLNYQNYDFTLLSDQPQTDNCRYVLSVEPKIPNKFLFRGRVWVDGTDFAVCRIEAEPAKNPSFWIKKTEIHHSYAKVGEFWLPTDNKSVSSVRMGGVATLVIKYDDYKIVQSHVLGQPAATTTISLTPAGGKPVVLPQASPAALSLTSADGK